MLLLVLGNSRVGDARWARWEKDNAMQVDFLSE